MEYGVNCLTMMQFKLRDTSSPKGFGKGVVELFLIPVLQTGKLGPKVPKKHDQVP